MKKILILLLSLILCLPFSACASKAEERTVVASFYPVYVFAQNVLSGVPDVRLLSLTPPSTGCLHDYQLLTSDMRILAGAQALMINGAGMEAFLPDVVSQFPSLPVIDLSTGVALISDDHGDNAHIWLDPENAALMVSNMAEGLKAALPESADLIAQNAAAYTDKLLALNSEIKEQIDALAHRDIVTFHEAFPYFAQAYGLNVIASVTLDPDESPSPAMLASIVKKVRAADNCPLFSEPGVQSSALKTVQSETGAPLFELDPVTSGSGEPQDYEEKMRENARVLTAALGTK